MTEPDFAADLALILTRPHLLRYRDLTDPRHPAYDPAYIPIVHAEAARIRNEIPLSDSDLIAARRAAKPRIAKGVKLPGAGHG